MSLNRTIRCKPTSARLWRDVCAVPALKLLVNNIRYLTLRDGPGMTRTERQTQGHRRRWSFPGNARGAASGSGRHLLQQGQSFGGPT
ncbi:hypothetical protein quinque_000125 [Culex quinquefasciatus]